LHPLKEKQTATKKSNFRKGITLAVILKAPPPQFNTQIHSYILSYALSTCGAEYQYKLSQEALTWTFAIPILLATSLRHNVHMINYTYLKYTIKIF
jgi:hypothetical protein